MSIKWNFKKYLEQKHSIYSATELKKIINKKTGISISLQNTCNYLNNKPVMIRLETMELICTALDCNLHDFLEISPSKKPPNKTSIKLSYKNTPQKKKAISDFPNPDDYSA